MNWAKYVTQVLMGEPGNLVLLRTCFLGKSFLFYA